MADKKIKTLSVKFEGDSTKLNTAIKQATSSFNDVDKAIELTQKRFNEFGKGKELDQQIEYSKELQQGIESSASALKQLLDFKRQLDKESDDNKLTKSYQELENLIEKIRVKQASYKQDLQELGKYSGNIEKISTVFEKVKDSIEKTSLKMTDYDSYLQSLNTALSYAPNSLELLSVKQGVLKDKIKDTQYEVRTLNNYIKQLGELGFDKTSKEVLDVQNHVDALKQSIVVMKAETVAYQSAMSNVAKLYNEFSTRENSLNEALRIDPNNSEIAARYLQLLREELKYANESVVALEKAQDDLNTKKIPKTSEEYINVVTSLVKARDRVEEIKSKHESLLKFARDYNSQINHASSLYEEIKTNASVLKESLDIDPSKAKASQYLDYLKESIAKANTEVKDLNATIKKMDSKHISKTSEEYRKATSTVTSLKTLIKQLKAEQDNLSPEVVEYNKKLTSVKSTLSNTSRVASLLKKELELDPSNVKKQEQYTIYLKNAIEQCENKQKDLTDEINKMGVKNIDLASDKYLELRETLVKTVSQTDEFKKALNDVVSPSNKAQSSVNDLTGELYALNTVATDVSRALGNVFKDALTDSMNYESKIASIKKIVKDLNDNTVQELMDLAVRTGTAFENIADYASLGATLGIAQDALTNFTEAMVKLETASDGAISGSDGAAMVARLLNQFQIGAQYAENFGSSVTYVGDQFAATADEIVETASRMGGLSAINNVTIHDLIGLASEMKNLGIETESGASAISKVFLNIENQVQTGGKKLETFAETAGMTADEFSKAWSSAPTEAFLSFVNGLSTQVFNEINDAVKNNSSSLQEYASALGMTADAFKVAWGKDATGTFEKYKDALGDLEEGSESASVILSDLSLSGVRVAQTMLKLAGNGNTVRDAIKDSSKAWEENTNLANKANTVYETTEYKLKSAKEALSQAAYAIGDTLLPVVKSIAETIADLAKGFAKLPKGIQATTGVVLALATGFSKLVTVGARTKRSIDILVSGNGALANATKGVLKVFSGSSGLVSVLGTALPVALGVAGGALLAYKLYQDSANNSLNIYNKKLEELTENADSNYISSLKALNNEYKDMPEHIEKANSLLSQLDFKNGTVDASTEAYNQLNSELEYLNSVMGGEDGTTFQIDKETGAVVNQNGEVVNLTDAWRNYYDEKKRQEWLYANEEKYNELLSERSQKVSDQVDLMIRINELKSSLAQQGIFTQEDLDMVTNIALGFKDISDYPEEIQQKYYTVLDQISEKGQGMAQLFSNFNLNQKAIDDADKFVNAFNSIQTEPLETALDLMNDISSEPAEAVITYNKESVDEVYAVIKDLNEKLLSLKEYSEQTGIDTSEQQAQIYEALIQAWNDLEDAERKAETGASDQKKAYDETKKSSDEAKKSVDKNKKSIDESKKSIDEAKNSTTLYVQELNKIPSEKRTRIIQEYSQIDLGSYSSGSTSKYKGSGGYGIMPKLVIPKLSSGGHSNTLTLNASFNINNNGRNITQNISKKIASEIVDMVNEELGKAV